MGPPVATKVVGNYIGLDSGGTVAVQITAAGILVGAAAETVIGGLRPAKPTTSAAARRRPAGPGADDLVVRGNLIGVGAEALDPGAPDPGIGSNRGLASPALEAAIANNV